MAKTQNLGTLVVITLGVAATLFGHTTGETYTVGGSGGWTFATNATAYAIWASQYNFTVGDVLEFNFVTGSHTVATVRKASYDTCNVTNPISLIREGPTNMNLSSPGELYFICTIGQHCTGAFQKLAINVTASSSSPPGDGPPSSGGDTPSPPPPSAATRIGLLTIFTILNSAAVYLLF